MKSPYLYLEIVRYIHYIIRSDYYCRRSTKRQMDFSRKGKMSFTDYIYAIIQNTKSSLQIGLNAFLDAHKKGQIEYSKQAFSKGRQRIKPEAFQELFQAVVLKFYEKAELASWHSYHLFGIDGTRLNLPCTDELAELYGVQSSNGAPQVQALVSCVYDLLNGIITDVRFANCRSSERDAAEDMIASFQIKQVERPVFVMDRGYPSAELIDAIIRMGYKFVMRCSTEFVRNMNLPEQDNIIEHKFAKLKKPVKIRILKVALSSGEIEYLVTNMERRVQELASLFKRLYEDNVLGRISNEQFRMLSTDYNAEQKNLEDVRPEKKARLEKLKASASNVDAFVEKAKRFTSIDELTPELLRVFIQRIEIGERAKKHSHSSPQKIRIVYKDIGVIDSEMEKGEQPVHMAAPLEENADMQLLA